MMPAHELKEGSSRKGIVLESPQERAQGRETCWNMIGIYMIYSGVYMIGKRAGI